MMRFFTVFTFILLLSSNTFSSEHYKNADASKLIKGTQELWFKSNSSFPSYIRFENGFNLDENEFFVWMKEEFNLSEELNFIQERSFATDDKVRHLIFQPTFNDVPIEFSRLTIHVLNGFVISMNGNVLDRAQVSNAPSISKKDAVNYALNEISSAEYKWEIMEEEKWLQERTGNKNATFYPQPEMVVIAKDADFQGNDLRYAYKMNVYSTNPFNCEDIYVDAQNGGILFRQSLLNESDSTGLAHTAFSGIRQIQTDHVAQDFLLKENDRGNGIHTWNLQQSTDFGTAVDFTDEDNNWLFAAGDLDAYATDAHWGAEVTYDYLLSAFGRNSIDDNGLELNSYIHYGEAVNSSRWDAQLEIMIFGDGPSNLLPLTTLDIVGHEIGHGLTQYTAGLIYMNESGALNESFSDILGNCAEHFGKPGQSSWRIGEDRGSFVRDMSFPNAKYHPDTYLGDFWYTGTDDNGGVHTNSGVQNYWFYLLSEGGNGVNDNDLSYDVSGIGIMNAALIAYRTLSVYLTPTSDYEEASYYSTLAAKDIFGNCSPQHKATVLAWNAVGLENEYIDHTVASFEADKVNYCNVPFTVEFFNESINGKDYTWNFGDGTTSNEISPRHEYTKAGTYSVKLMVDGAGCGNDEIEEDNLISASEISSPEAASTSIYRGDDVELYASTDIGEVHWFSDMDATMLLHKGEKYTTPSLDVTTTYYVQTFLEGSQHEVGEDINLNLVDGQYSALDIGLEFEVYQDVILTALTVKSQSSGPKTFLIKDVNGASVFEKEVDVVEGVQEVTLDAEIPKGESYVLSYTGSVKDMWLSNSNDYPYSFSGLATISGNTMDDNSYPYFYNLQFKEYDCRSGANSVTVSVEDINDVTLPPYNFYVNNSNGLNYYVDFFFRQNTRVKFALYGINGQLVNETEKEFEKGESTEDVNSLLDLNSYPTGVFFITISGGGIEETEKIVNKGGSN